MKKLLLGCLCILIFGCVTLIKPKHVHKQVCWLGETKVIIQKEDFGPGKTFVHVHANETTALDAARHVAQAEGGHVITLVHAKQRDIHFRYHGKDYSFDPNRIYTAQGIKKTLLAHGCYDKKSERIVARFAHQVLANIPRGKIIAVHNNKGYSCRDYLPKHELANDAVKLYLQNDSHYRNFFLVTKAGDFYRLKNSGFNVVHQAIHVCDDGSMSVALRKRHYINVEAAFGELHTQMNMIRHA
jgi:hypothetical protein